MTSDVDVSCETEILTDKTKVYGLIYEITNTSNNMKYVGQIANVESYIRNKGAKIAVRIDGKKAEFASKHETIEQLKERARAFITDLMQRYQIAGSP